MPLSLPPSRDHRQPFAGAPLLSFPLDAHLLDRLTDRSNDKKQFARLLADARRHHGTVLFADVATLDAVSRCVDSSLNPHCGALANDVLNYHLRPLVRVPHLVVCGAGGDNTETYALPLSAASPAAWVRLEDRHAYCLSVGVREGEILLTGNAWCSTLSPRTGRWSDGLSITKTTRLGHCSAQLGALSVICGGTSGRVALSSTLLLPAGDDAQWTQGCEMKTPRLSAGSAVVAAADGSSHRMLVVGGRDDLDSHLDSCELYDAASDRWSLQEARLPQAMQCRAAPVAGGSAVLSVQCDDWVKTRCSLLDVRSSSPLWQPMASPESARCFHTVSPVGEHSAVMLGGEDASRDSTVTAPAVRRPR